MHIATAMPSPTRIFIRTKFISCLSTVHYRYTETGWHTLS